MVKVEHDVRIERSPGEVYAFVTDLERIPEWQKVGGIRNVTRVDPGPLAVGSRFTMEREARGNVASIDAEVTALEPARRFDFHTIDNDGFVGDFATTLTPSGGGTNLHWSVRMQPPSLLYRLLQPIIAREIRKSAEADFAALRRTLESEASQA
jgi:uncharacterized protein YndB with AHSA1/START domain